SLELGGKNPNVVFADADLEDVLQTSLRAAFTNQGQICLSGSRILVEKDLYEQFTERFVEGAQALTVGDPLEEGSDLGALVSRTQLEKVERYLALAQEQGGTIRCGGVRPSTLNKRCQNGYFLEPAVITDLGPESSVNQEEIFGPVASILPFRDEQEAIAIANGTPYGLSASVWTRDLTRAHRVAHQLDSGTVWVNCWMLRDLRVPFGGMKQSGVGREGGEESLHFFTEPKNVCIRFPTEG
ncbi:MAG: aldehyde dehydrogenase family protein, partial [Planctomycetota bacterium]